jgi:hypothetical protein
VPVTVIGGALIGVAEHLVGFVDLLELLAGHVFVVVVGVILEGEPTEGSLYLFVGGVAVNA